MKYVTSEIFPFGRFASKVRYLSALFDSTENNEELIEELEKFIQERKQQ